MLDGGDARANRILDALRGVRVRCDTQSKIVGLLDGGAQLFGREFDGFWIAAVGENRTSGQDLDVIGAAVGQFAYLLPHLPRAVRHTVLQIPRQLDIRGEARHGARTLADGDVGAGDVHARPDENSLGNGIAHRHIVEGSIHAHIAHRGEAGQQRDAGVGDRRIRRLGGGLLEDVERLLEAGPDGLYPAAADHDELIREDPPRFHVDELAGSDDGHRGDRRRLLRGAGGGQKGETNDRRAELGEHDAPFGTSRRHSSGVAASSTRW